MRKVLSMKTLIKVVLPFVLLTMTHFVFGQGKPYDGPDDPAGDIAAEREGYMNGNRVYLYFQNTTELSDWPRVDVSKWPNDYTGTKMTDGINILITAQVFLENDTIPVTDPVQIATRTDLDTLWFCQTSFRGGMDVNPEGTVEWGLYPVFGYFNNDASNDYPAMSNIPNSWPPNGWPARGDELKWPGQWNGRFGLGVTYADLETYFVANDAQDQEYLESSDTLKYYPRPGVKIGDKKPDVTIQYGMPWGGLGIRVETRGYQWNNPHARDVIFWEYNISNISDYDLPQTAFGYHVDNAIGNDSNDELGYFDTYRDLCYSWDIDGIGQGGVQTGIMGFAFLESPGLAYDGIDNDEDGLTDEARDNEAVNKIGPTEGITNISDFLKFYKLEMSDLKEHWDADEDQDWRDGFDANGDNKYSIEEDAGDDVGLDGIGPGELNYPGPDEGECNHKPDFKEGIGCEPNFAATDISESDMIGLTSFNLFQVTEQLNGRPRTFHADWVMWQLTGTGRTELWEQGIANLIEVFGAGPFPLYKGRTERISMACLHSYEELSDLTQAIPYAPVMFELKEVVQLIYEKDYRFAQPPKMPTLHATPGDGEVILTWDNIAEVATREPFLAGKNDFEGYKLIRATDNKFQDAEVITDGNGDPLYYKPIFQCDLKDGIKGYSEWGQVRGVGYDLGRDNGITHYFVDQNVQNGKTYYYGLIAYDYGLPDSIVGEPGISPSETKPAIELDEYEQIRQYSKNVAIATPHQTALGYEPHSLEIISSSIKPTSGSVYPEIVDRNRIKDNHTYKIVFEPDTIFTHASHPYGIYYTAAGYKVYDMTDSTRLVVSEDKTHFIGSNIVSQNISHDISVLQEAFLITTDEPISTDLVDGVKINIKSDVITTDFSGFDYSNSGWIIGNATVHVYTRIDTPNYFPWDYELVFTNNANAYTSKIKTTTNLNDETGAKIDKEDILFNLSFPFYMINKTFLSGEGTRDTLDILVHDINQSKEFEFLEDKVIFIVKSDKNRFVKQLFTFDFDEEPQPNDTYFLTFIRPFFLTDSLVYKVLPEGEKNIEAIKSEMDKIKVVPNPYVATNTMEPVVANWNLNQRRRLLFTHLPAQCEIKIFTASGVLVDKIEVDNDAADGTAHWDLESEEGLEIAAGIYIYYVKAKDTNAEKIGKFAVIK
jgi:hypothetical protein